MLSDKQPMNQGQGEEPAKARSFHLGIIRNYLPPPDTPLEASSPEAKMMRYALQSVARGLLKKERVAFCSRQMIHARVSVNRHVSNGNARFGGLMMCCSVWNCPVCAARISEQRRSELETGVDRHKMNDGGTLLLTVTLQHEADDELSDLLSKIQAAMQRVKSGKSWSKFKARHGIVGGVYSLEVTWGHDTGWHPHRHELLLLDHVPDGKEIRVMLDWLKERYLRFLAKVGGYASLAHGLTLEQDTVAGYIAKFGRDPAWLEKGGFRWTEVYEITKAVAKTGRGQERLTPFGMLRVVLDERDDTDEVSAAWVTYAQTFKGKKQIHWWRGTKALLLIDEVSDDEIVNDMDDYGILAYITRSGWQRVLDLDARAAVLAAAMESKSALLAYCDRHGISYEIALGGEDD